MKNQYLQTKEEHVTEEQLQSFFEHTMDSKLELQLLEHVSQCTMCAAYLADCLEHKPLLALPNNLKEELNNEIIKQSSLQTNLKKEPFTIKQLKMQLFLYSIRVGIAMCIALFLLFSSNKIPIIQETAILKLTQFYDANEQETAAFIENFSYSVEQLTDKINSVFQHINFK